MADELFGEADTAHWTKCCISAFTHRITRFKHPRQDPSCWRWCWVDGSDDSSVCAVCDVSSFPFPSILDEVRDGFSFLPSV